MAVKSADIITIKNSSLNFISFVFLVLPYIFSLLSLNLTVKYFYLPLIY